jgi:hypothetical protein
VFFAHFTVCIALPLPIPLLFLKVLGPANGSFSKHLPGLRFNIRLGLINLSYCGANPHATAEHNPPPSSAPFFSSCLVRKLCGLQPDQSFFEQMPRRLCNCPMLLGSCTVPLFASRLAPLSCRLYANSLRRLRRTIAGDSAWSLGCAIHFCYRGNPE